MALLQPISAYTQFDKYPKLSQLGLPNQSCYTQGIIGSCMAELELAVTDGRQLFEEQV